jgi:hypothetical protein
MNQQTQAPVTPVVPWDIMSMRLESEDKNETKRIEELKKKQNRDDARLKEDRRIDKK